MRTAICILAIVLHSSWISPQPAAAQEGENNSKFDDNVKKGVDAYGARRYNAAIQYFRDAYAIKQDPTLIYNIARSYERLGQLDDAISHYQAYVDAPGTTSDERTEALTLIKKLRQEQAARDAARVPEPPAPTLPALSKQKKPETAKTTVEAVAPPGPAPVLPQGNKLVLVVNSKNVIPELTKQQLRDIYFGRMLSWPSGQRVKPFARPLNSAASAQFFGKDTTLDAAQYSRHWQKQQLTGSGLAPTAIESGAALIKSVASNEGGLGYVLASELPQKLEGVRLVELR